MSRAAGAASAAARPHNEAYLRWTKRFMLFSHLAVQGKASASAQAQPLSALMFSKYLMTLQRSVDTCDCRSLCPVR